MSNAAGTSVAVKRLSYGIMDAKVRDAVRTLEDKVIELDARLKDAERRLAAGGL